MYRAFELVIDENNLEEDSFQRYVTVGRNLVSASAKDAEALLREVLSSGTIDGTALSERYFPILKRDVFLSYSHDDMDLAYMVAGLLREYFNLDVFIDSYFWGSADKLLKEIDNKYCWQKESDTYNYMKRNFSTSHVHAMLTASIIKAMDSAEVVIFLNTPKSVPDIEVTIDNEGYNEYTISPWIYEEMLLTTIMKKTNWELYRRDWRAGEEPLLEHFDQKLRVKYKLPKDNLIPLTLGNIEEWYQKYQKRQKTADGRYGGLFLDTWQREKHPLNVLYEMKCGVEKVD